MTYSFVLLVEVVHVSVQDLYEQLYRHPSVHTRVSDTKSTLETLKDTFPIAVQL